MIKKFEAKSIEEACELASKELNCTIDKLHYEIMQYPSNGVFGLFSKKAIIAVVVEKSLKDKKDAKEEIVEVNNSEKEIKEEKVDDKKAQAIETIEEEKTNLEPKLEDSEIIDSFFNSDSKIEQEKVQNISAQELESQIKQLFSYSCFNLDTIEVDIEDNTAYVFIDGEDAALLIGKEGYRYNALSYILFNWINVKYGLYLKLEIAQFLASQQDMIIHQLQPVVEHVNKEGWGRTKELNGILVQIALEYLRDTFPDKYVAIKRAKNGERYIIINEFNQR